MTEGDRVVGEEDAAAMRGGQAEISCEKEEDEPEVHRADEEAQRMACERGSGSEAARESVLAWRDRNGGRNAPGADIDTYDAVLGLRSVEQLDGDPVRRRDFRFLQLGDGCVRGGVKENCRWSQRESEERSRGTRTEGREDHEEALAERGRDLAVVELADGQPLLLRQIQSDLCTYAISYVPTLKSLKHAPSQVSRIAVYRPSSSSGSCRPPGNAMWPLHLSVARLARLMNKISAVVPGA